MPTIPESNSAQGSPPPRASVYQGSWLLILCLVGLDYFSTLGYQPSIAYEAAGPLAPLATIVVVLVTFGVALPIYAYVAGKSPHGQGSIALLNRLVPGWTGKLLVLALLGFAATDFVFTKTLSVADAAEHITHNPAPLWQAALDTLAEADDAAQPLIPDAAGQRISGYWNKQVVITLLLLIASFTFWHIFRRGFTRRVIQLSVIVVAAYLLVNAVVIGSGVVYLANHSEILEEWWARVGQGSWHGQQPAAGTNWWMIAFLCVVLFPKMALGLSGFEMSMVAMPYIKGDPGDDPARPRRRIRNTRKLLVAAAVIMAIYLLGSSLVTSLLIPPDAFAISGRARYRALAYLAHGGQLVDAGSAVRLNPLFGDEFGTLYDLSSVLILCLAGAGITLGLRSLVPQFLQQMGMEVERGKAAGLIFHVFNLINVLITVIFGASVSAQRGAYATSVLVLIGGAAVIAACDSRRTGGRVGRRLLVGVFSVMASVFLVTVAAVVASRPDGIAIAILFILAILVSSITWRIIRSTELRFHGFEFKDEQSRFLWESLKPLEFPVLVPHRPGRYSLADRERDIRQRHRLTPEIPIVFVVGEVEDASEFYQRPLLEVKQEEGRFVIRITHSASVAHVIAIVGLELSKVGKPPEIHLGWSEEGTVAATLSFLLFGQGNVPWLVHELIRKAEPDAERRPKVVVG